MHVHGTELAGVFAGVPGVPWPGDKPDLPPASVLRSAAEVIGRNGWVQEAYCDFGVAELSGAEAAPVCAAGAIRLAATGLPDEESDTAARAEAEFAEFLRRAYDMDPRAEDLPVEVIARWNDAPDRQAAQVISALRSAAEAVA